MIEKADVLSGSFASIFTGKLTSHIAQVTERKVREWENEDLHALQGDQV